jgi:hypothetical protein
MKVIVKVPWWEIFLLMLDRNPRKWFRKTYRVINGSLCKWVEVKRPD